MAARFQNNVTGFSGCLVRRFFSARECIANGVKYYFAEMKALWNEFPFATVNLSRSTAGRPPAGEGAHRIARLQLFELVQRAEDDQTLAYIAAGLLENLVLLHAPSVIDRVEAAARSDPRFRRALTGVWIDTESGGPEDVLRRLEDVIRGEPPL